MDSNVENQVKRRRMFYIPGYDPIHPRRYRELYRSEGKAQSEISGYELELKAKPTKGNYGWQVEARMDGQRVHLEAEVLVWSDIVRDSMKNSIIATYWQLLCTAWIYISTGALWRLMRLRKGPVIAALYPVGMLVGQLLLALFSAMIIFRLNVWIYEVIKIYCDGKSCDITPWFPLFSLIFAGLSCGVFIGILRWFKAKDAKLFAYYLMHDYAYSAQTWGENSPQLEARLQLFATEIAQALRSDVDEVLIVGHSSGAHLGVSILADVLRNKPHSAARPELAFLTLGQVVPMVSFLPRAHRLRADLQFLSEQENFAWVDVTAPGDGCAFALCDPVSVSGVARAQKRWPLVFSAAFTQSLSPARWKALRWRFFRLHFQYLCAFDRPKDYDYFQITAGARTLKSRYAHRAASKSRIDYAVSKYTTVSP